VRIAGVVRSTVIASLAIGIALGGVGVAGPADATDTDATPAPAPAIPSLVVPIVRHVFRLDQVDGVRYTPNARNIALRSSVDAPLLLFLPATGAVPEDYREFLDAAGGVGYHVLALDYWNRGRSVAQTCARDARCYSDLQANRFDGSHPTHYSSIAPSDSILARLRHALRTLGQRDPRGGWGRFVHGDRIRWDRIVLAGHSQGGGESAFIAHGHRAQGVLMFGSPVESDQGVTAAWMSRRGVTPVARYYALDSAHDMYAERITGSWRALHLPGRPREIGTDAPSRLGHQLVTDHVLGTAAQSHSLFITDRGPRGDRNAPAFRDVWLAMLTAVRGPLART
jgi:hypothetical protein